ncbi:hypothetical protein ACGFZP_37960 [Kitasatospora sp. NPDC048239]|uniref:hypothetical protein n=1 Tax=Kitasatospora sp. NPDC048239 TaxID=3364046 RepID=UPI0037122FE8
MLPTPEAVAAAVRQLFTGGLRYRQTADDTPPTSRPGSPPTGQPSEHQVADAAHRRLTGPAIGPLYTAPGTRRAQWRAISP